MLTKCIVRRKNSICKNWVFFTWDLRFWKSRDLVISTLLRKTNLFDYNLSDMSSTFNVQIGASELHTIGPTIPVHPLFQYNACRLDLFSPNLIQLVGCATIIDLHTMWTLPISTYECCMEKNSTLPRDTTHLWHQVLVWMRLERPSVTSTRCF